MAVADLINKYTVYDYLIVFLLILFAVNSTTQNLWQNSVPHIIITVGLAVFLDLALSFLKSKRKPKEGQMAPLPFKIHLPKSGFISGLIIGLLIEPTGLSWPALAPVIMAPLVAILLKHLIRIKGDHIFNPANLGLLVTITVLASSISWWGASPPWLVALFGLFLAYRLKRPNPALAFLAVYFLLTIGYDAATNTSFTSDSILQQLNNGTILFFGFIMVQEPVTAPRSSKSRLIFGILVAIFAFALTFYLRQYSLLLGLVLADLFVLPLNWKLK